MPKNKNRSLFNKFLKKMSALKKEKSFSDISSALKSGKNTYMRIDRLESSNFDMVWIKRIEDCIYDLGEIIANPKEVTKTVTGIVPVELAKKIGSESVIHLASHTQYIKDITPEGDVIPNKILNIGSEEDIHTYENRFIATLVRRLVLFIEKRYEFVKKFAPLHDEEILYFKNKTIYGGEEIEIETKIKVRSESSTKMADTNNKYIDRILKIREYILYFYGSKFMKELKTERDVRNPIVMTNILRKNPKYHKCYELFRFIEKYEGLGVAYKVDENVADFSEQDMNEMNSVMLSNYLALQSKDKKKLIKSTHKQYKPRILTSLDDEEFVYGDLLKGPIEFLRVDQGYLDYLESQVKKDLPQHPTKLEKEYYKDEFKEKADLKVKKAALDKLEKRKKKEQAEFDKKAKAMVARREKEEAERIAREQEAARLEEEKRIEAIRQQLVENAKAEHPVEEQPIPEQPETIIEQPLEEEVLPVEEELVEETPIEEEPVEQVQVEEERVQEPISEPEQPVVEEAPIVEETPVTEEQPQVIEEPQEEVKEEVIEQPVEEESVNEETDLDAIRRQLIESAQEEEPIEEPQPEEEAEVAPINEEQPAEEPVIEEIPVEEEAPVVEEKVEEPVSVEEETQPEEQIEEAVVEEPAPVVEEVKEEPQEVEPVVEEVKPEPVPQPKKKKTIVWITFTDKDGKTKKVPQFIVDGEEQPAPKAKPAVAPQKPAEEPAPVVEEVKPEPIPEQPKKKKSKIVWVTFTDHEGKTKKVPQRIYEDEEESHPTEKVVEVKPEPKAKKAKPIKEEKVEEPAPVEEEKKPEPVEETPVIEEPVEKEEKAEILTENSSSAEILDENKEEKHSRRERKPKKEKPQKEEHLGPKLEPIPGRFVVKTNQGYFVNKNKYTVYKHEAWVFADFNDANRIKNTYGGKVVKL